MARPTKQQKEDRSKNEAILKRDIFLYADFERRCRAIAVYFKDEAFMAHEMTRECVMRYYEDDIIKIIKDLDAENQYIEECKAKDNYAHRLREYELSKKTDFDRYFSIGYPILEFLKDSGNEKILQDFGSPVDEYYQEIDSEIQVCCNHTAREAIKELYGDDVELNKKFFNMPVIAQSGTVDFYNKKALVQIDFTKSKKEIMQIVSKIKDEFDAEPTTILGLDEYLGIESFKDVYSFTKTNENAIYRHGRTKSLEGRLGDVLFIYDCHKKGLTSEYIIGEINRYWRDIKKKYTDEFQKKTYRAYLKFAKNEIGKRGFVRFISGVNVSK